MKKENLIKKEMFIPTFIILVIMLLFFFPVTMNNLCKPGSVCPISNSFIKITELGSPTLVGINYIYLIVEIIISYILAEVLIYFYRKNKK